MSTHILWSSELSPYSWKIRALLDFKRLTYRVLPDNGGWLENLAINHSLFTGKKKRSIIRYPQMTELDEYPAVPYLVSGSLIQYDSSSIADWLDAFQPSTTLIPTDPPIAFVVNLIDEAFDEFGLYMAHHMRWVTAAQDNDAGKRLSHEFRRVLPLGLNNIMGLMFARRQVRRLPYLFSVAPIDYQCDMPIKLTPPSLEDFPPTHGLLNLAWGEYLAALETIFTQQRYLMGNQFTLADASVYGQLYMNMSDPSAAKSIKLLAPATYQWLINIHHGKHVLDRGKLFISPHLSPLLTIISKTFITLMKQNEQAYDTAKRENEIQYNELAFDNRTNIYAGEMLGFAFKSVVKSFQVDVWQSLQSQWSFLTEADIKEIHQRSDYDISQLFLN